MTLITRTRGALAAARGRLRRAACVRQRDANDCGPACLATIARHFGLELALGRIRELCRADAMGSNLLGLAKAAEALGFAAKPAKASWDALARCPRPFVAHVQVRLENLTGADQAGHFWVVHEIEDGRVLVADPAAGLRWVPRAEFEAAWTGHLLLVVPTPRLAGVEPSAPSWRRFAGLLAGRGSLLLESAVASVLYAALGLGTSFYVQHLIDDVLVRGDGALLHLASLGALALIGFRIVFHVIQRYLLVHLAQKIDVALAMEYYQHVLGLPLGFFEARRTGEVLSRLADAQKIRNLLSGTILSSSVDALFVLVAGAVMFLYDPRLAVVTLAVVPLFLAVVLAHRGALRREQRKAAEQGAALQSHLVEVVSGAAAVKAARAEDHVRAGAERRLVALARTSFRVAMLAVSTQAFAALVASCASIVVLWYGGALVVRGELSIGRLLFFQSLLAHVLEPLSRLTEANVELEDAAIAADRVNDVLSLAPEQPRGAERLRPARFTGRLVLEDVHFRYGFRDWALQGVSLEVPPGKTIALVGRSGSGKSTIGKLAARFHDPTRGRVLVDGDDLRDIDLSWYRGQIGVVDQECVVFSSSIADNIRLGEPHASLAEVVAAAKQAGAHEFIESLPERYETIVGERGANLSGGQRQRIAIARAILGDPRILILDEATSHLDSETERAVQATLAAVRRGRSTLVIAHRLSTVMLADRVHVLDKGRIVESGTHAELIRRGGIYTEMWAAQTPARPFDAEAPRRGDFAIEGLEEPGATPA